MGPQRLGNGRDGPGRPAPLPHTTSMASPERSLPPLPRQQPSLSRGSEVPRGLPNNSQKLQTEGRDPSLPKVRRNLKGREGAGGQVMALHLICSKERLLCTSCDSYQATGHLPPARARELPGMSRLLAVSRPAPSPVESRGPPDPHSTHQSEVSGLRMLRQGLWPLQHPKESLPPARFPSKKCD